MEQNKKDVMKPILIGVIILLLGVIGYLVYDKGKKEDKIADQQKTIEVTQDSLDSKVKELTTTRDALMRAQMELKDLNQDNDSLAKQVQELNDLIQKVKNKSFKDMNALNAKIASLNKLLAEKDAQISALKMQNDTLNVKVADLSKEKATMGDSLANIRSQRSALEQQVAIASVLKSDKISVKVFNSKDKEVSGPEYKAKNINKLNISYVISDNKVARKGQRVVYMRLIEPSGIVIYDNATGGGLMKAGGKEIPYTDKRTISFENNGKTEGFGYVKGSEYKVGQHTIELYCDGELMGTTKLIVK